MKFFANTAMRGVIGYRQLPALVGIFDSADKTVQVGIASMVGWSDHEAAVWCLEVNGVVVPGRFIIIDSAFVQVDPDPD